MVALGRVLAVTVAAILLTTMAMRTVAFQKIIDFLLRRGKCLPDTYCFPPHIEVTATPPATLVRTPLDKQIIADGRIGSHNLLAKIILPFELF